MFRRWPLPALLAALALITPPAAAGAHTHPPALAGWHGRAIRDPLPRHQGTGVTRYPRGWSAGAVRLGTGYASPRGSRRVREVQRRLRRRGYRPGPVDGLFGPRTQAAVLWFEIKHGLPRSGRVDARTLATLRNRNRPARRASSTHADRPRSVAPQPPDTATGAPPPSPSPGEGINAFLMVLAGVALLGLAALLALGRAELRARRPRPARIPASPRPGAWDAHTGAWDERPAACLPAAALPAAPLVIAYIALPPTADRRRQLVAAAELIGAFCQHRGWQLARLAHDLASPSAPLAIRPGLHYALDQITHGRAAGLVLAHLGDLTQSPTELATLLERIDRAGGFLVALDHQLDTTTPTGRRAADMLVDVGGWGRDRAGGPAGRTLAANGASTPWAAHDPQLRVRINAMRARGMALQAICDTLNAEGVPTPRPGERWRPSSVDLATAPPLEPSRFKPASRARADPQQAR